MKRILSVIAGVVVGFITVFIGDATSNALHPWPMNLDYHNRDVLREYMNTIPGYILVIMMIFWLGSAFLGGMLAARINRADWKRTAMITGAILMAAALSNLVMIPHPTWMWIAALAGYIPAALLGGWLVRPKLPSGIGQL
jgi:hypothetical protein